MNYWDNAPFIRLVPPLVAGILFSANLGCPISMLLVCLVGFLLISFIFAAKILVCSYTLRWIPGLFINGLLFLTGSLLHRHHQVVQRPEWLGYHLSEFKYLVGTPESIATPGPKTTRIIFIVSAGIDSIGSSKYVEGKIILYLPNSYSDRVLPGDEWLITAASEKRIISTHNPAAFDFAQYCARQNIYHQAYLREKQLVCIKSRTLTLSGFLASGQLSALKSMRASVPENERGLAMALLIGYRNEVAKSLLQAYTNTGVVHVIAVSGMHLGLIFLLLQKLIVFPDRKIKVLKLIKAIMVLIVIWIFSGIAGAAASIIRAAFMFSMVLLSKLIRKPMDNIQSICVGAFALLCYNPLWLWDAGFQLSFAALLSIICYQPLVTAWIQVKNPILKSIWDLSAATISAQILTLPICIFLFHQAPVYFLFANLIAIPLSSIALITAILQWIISFTGLPFTFAGQITGFLIQQMNAAIKHFNSLPGSLINQIEWSPALTCAVYIMIIALTGWFVNRSKHFAVLGLATIFVITIIRFIECYQSSRQELLHVFHLQQKRLVVIVQGKSMNLLSAEVSTISPELAGAKRVYHCQELLPYTASLFRYRDIRFAFPSNATVVLPLLGTVPDFLFLPENLRNIDSLIPAINSCTTIIIDGKTPAFRADLWKTRLEERGVKCYTTWESGALQIPVNKF